MTPTSCLRWKPMGKNFKTVGLRWVPTRKIFASSTTKVDSELLNGSNADITNQYECEQTFDVSACTLNLSAELRLHDHSNEQSSSKLVIDVVPPADKTDTSRQKSYALSWKPYQGDSLNLPDHRKPRRKVIEVPQPSNPIEHVADKAIHKELGDSLVRAATTASSLEAKVESLGDKKSLGKDASKQGRRIDDINANEDITQVSVHDDADKETFDADKDLGGEEKMFDRAFKRVNTFVDFKAELVEGSSKRTGEELTQERAKKQKVDDDKETTDLIQLMKIIPDKEEVAIDAIPLAVKSPGIVD
nr:hypothetical protein [Tanacetum cinerariifolium]